jgi:hypothetical protein
VREAITHEREANAIRLRRSTFSGTFLLVEGSTDKIFYERFVNKIACEVSSISGKPSSRLRVLKVLKILDDANFHGVLAIVDADFGRLKSPLSEVPNLIYTDTHDLETILLNSPALYKVVAEFGSEDKVANFEQGVRTALLEAGMPIGYLRWISQLDSLNLTFEGIKFSKFIGDRTLQTDEFKLIEEVKNKSQAFALKSRDLQQRLINQKSDNHDPWQICCGHDLVEILSLGLSKAIGSAKASDVTSESLERSLRLAYEETYFCQTQIYMSVKLWESENQSFRVLRSNL